MGQKGTKKDKTPYAALFFEKENRLEKRKKRIK
jgi:hypothetical protein